MAKEGKVVGRISVKVMPDTTDFRDALRDDLRRIQKSTELKIRVVLDKQSMRHTDNQIQRWSKRGDRKVDIGLDLNSAALKIAQARLSILARNRIARIVPMVDKASASKAAGVLGTLVAAASGGRVVNSFAKNMVDAFKELDTLAPKIGAIGLGILNIGAAGLSSASNLFALSSALASIGAVALTMPAAFASLAIGLGITIIALKDMKKVLPDVYQQFQDMKRTISTNFWAGAKDGIRELATVYLPELADTAKHVGSFWGKFSSELSKPLKASLPGMFDQLNKAIKISADNSNVFAGVISKLGSAGAAWLPRMAQWVVDVSAQFDKWLGKVTSNGQFDQWIENGVTALKDLGRVAVNGFNALSGIADAARAAGGSSLGMLADTLGKIADVINGPAFQKGLTAAFEGAHKAIEAIGKAAGPQLITFFSTLGTSLGSLLPLAGGALGTALGGIATGLTTLLNSGGVTTFFTGIATAISALAPTMPVVGQALGVLAGQLGVFLATIGPSFAAIFTTLATALIQLAPVIMPVVTALGQSLAGALQTAAPAIISIVTALAGMLAPIAGNSTAVLGLATAFLGLRGASAAVKGATSAFNTFASVKEGITGTVNALTRVKEGYQSAQVAQSAFSGVSGSVGGALRKAADGAKLLASQLTFANAKQVVLTAATKVAAAVQWALNAAMTANPIGLIIAAIVLLVGALVLLFKKNKTFHDFVIKVWEGIKNAVGAVADWFTGTLLPALVAVWEGIKNAVSTAITFVAGIITSVISTIGAIWSAFWGTFGGLITVIWQVIVAAITLYITIIWTIIQLYAMAIMAVWNFLWNGIKAVVTAVWGFIVSIVTFYVNLVLAVITAVWNGIKAATLFVWNGIKAVIGAVWGAIGGRVMAAVALVKALVVGAWNAIKERTSAAFNAVKSKVSEVFNALKGIVTTAIGKVMEKVNGIKAKVTGAFSSAATWLKDAGTKVIQGFIKGLTDMFGNVRDTLQGLTKRLTDWKGPAPVDRKLLTPAGQLVMQSFLNGLESEYDTIRRSLNGFTAEIGSTEINSPRIAPVSGDVSAALNAAIDDGSAAPSGGTKVDVNLYGSDVSAADVADEFLFATRRIASGGVYARKVNP